MGWAHQLPYFDKRVRPSFCIWSGNWIPNEHVVSFQGGNVGSLESTRLLDTTMWVKNAKKWYGIFQEYLLEGIILPIDFAEILAQLS